VLHPDIQRILDEMLAVEGTDAEAVPIAQARAAHEQETARLGGPGPAVAEVREVSVPGPGGAIAVRAYRPRRDGALGVVAYLHGGGWAVGSLDSFDTVCRGLALAADALVASVDYRLAPEHGFPAAVDDALAAVRWLAAHAGELGGDPERLAVAGDSAGGNLATVVARRLRGEIALRHQALIYPVCDAGLNTPSYRAFGTGHGLTAAGMRRFWALYLDGADGTHPDASPLRADDLSGLAPAYVLTAEEDVLRDEGEAYAERLRAAGVDVTARRWPGTIHGFWRWQATAEPARAVLEEVGAALHAALASPG
jgi:acetyl esterase